MSFVVLLSWFMPARATTWTVDAAGGGDAATIGEGLALVADGDTLDIAEGRYDAAGLMVVGVGIVIRGAGWERTILENGAGYEDASGIFAYEAEITFEGISFRGYDGYAAVGIDQSNATFSSCAFLDNEAGIGTYSGAEDVTIHDVLFAGNEVALRMDQYILFRSLWIENSLFINNDQGVLLDGWMNDLTFDRLVAVHNTFIGEGTAINVTNGYSGGSDAGTEILIANNVFAGVGRRWNVGFDIWGATAEIRNNVFSPLSAVGYPDDVDWITQVDNLEAEPVFVAWSDDDDWSNDDLHLLAGSPGIDAGAPGYSTSGTDADGVERAVDGDGDGVELPDAGLYEFAPPGYASEADSTARPSASEGCGCASVGGSVSRLALALIALAGLSGRRRLERVRRDS